MTGFELTFEHEKVVPGQALWLTPVTRALERLRQAKHLRSGDQDQPGQHGETLSLLKIQKLAGLAGRGGSRL